MAVQVSNRNQLNFGTLAGEVTITHGRIRRASDDVAPIVKQFCSSNCCAGK